MVSTLAMRMGKRSSLVMGVDLPVLVRLVAWLKSHPKAFASSRRESRLAFFSPSIAWLPKTHGLKECFFVGSRAHLAEQRLQSKVRVENKPSRPKLSSRDASLPSSVVSRSETVTGWVQSAGITMIWLMTRFMPTPRPNSQKRPQGKHRVLDPKATVKQEEKHI